MSRLLFYTPEERQYLRSSKATLVFIIGPSANNEVGRRRYTKDEFWECSFKDIERFNDSIKSYDMLPIGVKIEYPNVDPQASGAGWRNRLRTLISSCSTNGTNDTSGGVPCSNSVCWGALQ